MKLILAVAIAAALATTPALAQCGGCANMGSAGCSMGMTASLKLVSMTGDTVDLPRLGGTTSLVVLVMGTDSASRAAAAVVQKAFAATAQPGPKFAGVVNAGPKTAKATAKSLKLGYTVLADPDKKAMAWLKADAVPFAAFVNGAGQVVRTESKITDATVTEGVKALAQTQEKLVDPVCGMTVTKETAAGSYVYKGQTYYFCSKACKDSFTKDPQKYLAQ
jgi:YHS domain-containing protein